MALNLSILQWNINGCNPRSAILQAIVQIRYIGIAELQEALTVDNVCCTDGT